MDDIVYICQLFSLLGLYITDFMLQPASVVQLDARPTGDQKVVGSILAKVSNILSWRLIMK